MLDQRATPTPLLLPVWDLSEWEAIRVEFLAPAGLQAELNCQRDAIHENGWSIAAVPRDGPANLLHIAARCAFWNFNRALLHQVATITNVPIESGATEFDLVWTLVSAHSGAEVNDVLQIVARRLDIQNVGPNILEEVLYIDEARKGGITKY